MRLDLGKFVLHVVGVHSTDLLASWGPKYFDDLYKLIDARFSWEQRLTKHELCHNTASGPDI